MRPGALLLASLVTSAVACTYSLDERVIPPQCKVSTAAQVCIEAEDNMVSDLAWLQTNLFATNCSGDDCHGDKVGGGSPGGRFVLTHDAYTALVGVKSQYDPAHVMVDPGHPERSYLLYIMHGIRAEEGVPPFKAPPSSVGFMPQSNSTLCCQKLDAVRRWIEAGAPQ
jgi:hypothetical protein